MSVASRFRSLFARSLHKKPVGLQLQFSRSFAAAEHKNRLYIVGIDGTQYGYMALERAFECCNKGDKIIGMHFPSSFERLEVDLMIFGAAQTPEMKNAFGELEKYRDKKTDSVIEKCHEIASDKDPNKVVTFEVKVGEPTPSTKHDLVRACFDFEADTLVLGSKGLAHGIKEHLKKDWKDIVGSVPDYCVHHAPCDVLVVKPPEY